MESIEIRTVNGKPYIERINGRTKDEHLAEALRLAPPFRRIERERKWEDRQAKDLNFVVLAAVLAAEFFKIF